MNKKDKLMWYKKRMSNFDRTIVTRKNSLNEIGSHSYEHELWVFRICRYLISGGKYDHALCNDGEFACFGIVTEPINVYTEIRSVDRKFRADILAMTFPTPTIIEVAVSEKQESLDKKRKYWEGKGFDYEVVKV